jgi:hypothetical protein
VTAVYIIQIIVRLGDSREKPSKFRENETKRRIRWDAAENSDESTKGNEAARLV